MEDDEKFKKLKGSVESNLAKQVSSLENVKKELEEDLKSCPPSEREKNQKLLDATVQLLEEMKMAQANIVRLIKTQGPTKS